MPETGERTRIGRRQVLGWAGAVATLPLAGVAGGCANQPSPAGGTGAKGSGEVTFMYMGEASQQKQWQALFAEFSRANPEITLKAQGLSTNNWADFANQVASRIAGGRSPDMIQVATEGQRMFAAKHLLDPLDPYIERDRDLIDEYYADVDPHLIEWTKKYGSPDGKTYFLPGEFNTMCMWCNTELFDQAGARLPEGDEDWTWEEFYTAAKQIKAKTGAFAYNVDAAYFVSVMPWLLTNGTSSLDAQWRTATIGSPAAVEAVTYLRRFADEGLSPAPGGTFDEPTALAQNKLAVMGRGRWGIVGLKGVGALDKVRIVKWPKNKEQGTPVGWNGYPILRKAKNKDAAWTFAKFLISKQGSSFFAKLGGTIVPARKSVAKSDAFLGGAPPGTDLFYPALKYATPVPSPDRGAEVQKAVEDAWNQILSGAQQPEPGLTALADQIGGML